MELRKLFTDIFPKYFNEYELRQSQIDLASLVLKGIKDHKHVMVEAPTGTGKSFGYLIPAILSKKRVVVSTSNKSLQDQLSTKDLPTLKDIFKKEGIDFEYMVLKGKNNYFCKLKYELNKAELITIAGEQFYKEIGVWASNTEDGDLDKYPGDLTVGMRELICCDDSVIYTKENSHYASYDFYKRAKEASQGVDVLLTNHTLVGLDVMLSMQTGMSGLILPGHDVLILDEAHAFFEAVERISSESINEYSLTHFLLRSVVKDALGADKVSTILGHFREAINRYIPPMREGHYIHKRVKKFEGFNKFLNAMTLAVNELDNNKSIIKSDKDAIKVKGIVDEGKSLVEKIRSLCQESSEDTVLWAEAKRNKINNRVIVTMRYSTIEVPEKFKSKLLDEKVVVCTSATLTVNNSFDYFSNQYMFNKDNAYFLITESPFDYKKNALIYFSKPNLNKVDEVKQLLKASKGRALYLFTSYKAMSEMYMNCDVPYKKLVQREGVSRFQLLQEFMDSENAVLFATKSFWEGIDIKGEKLSLVIIDKLPFPNVGDILFKSKCDLLDKKAGKNVSFMNLSIPMACLTLKQGSGRLIRSKTDRGVIALLDDRINTARYAGIIVRSFPETAVRTQKLEYVHKFFNS